MTSVFRHVVLLSGTIAFFLVVLGGLLWARHAALEQQSTLNDKLLAPSQMRVAQAQRALIALQSELYLRSSTISKAEANLHRFDLLRALEDIDQNVVQLARLAHEGDYGNAFDLPARAHEQLQSARSQLTAYEPASRLDAAQVAAALDPLQHTLQQLARIYEIDQQRALEDHARMATGSLKLVVLAGAVLAFVTVPLFVRLVLGLRKTVRGEIRMRNDLEEATRNLEVMAMYDGLTQLGNRHLFRTRLERAAGAASRSDRLAALMYIDLDDFKRINDSLGHEAGDEVLKAIGKRLAESVRSADTVARIGGDEFTVLLTDMVSQDNASTIAAKLLERIREPIRVSGHELVVSGSIGITIMPADGDDPTVLMKNADMALYRAKARGRNTFQFFVEAMNRAATAQMTMESELRAALRHGDFQLAYQPQVELTTGKVTGVEALLRWPREGDAMVPPDEFIPVAEATGLMTEIGGWVIEQACRDLARLRRSQAPELRVAINLSPRQFRDPILASRIRDALDAHRLPHSALEVEITETMLIEQIEDTSEILESLRAIGITVAVDDFGIGYSSLNYLKNLPIDALKIDRSFVRDIETDEADRSIVAAMLAMARSLSLRTVGEGIETRGQLEFLAERGCGQGQGFLLSAPASVDGLALEELHQTWSPLLATRAARRLHAVD